MDLLDGQITPSLELEWNDCFESFQCAKLDVSLAF